MTASRTISNETVTAFSRFPCDNSKKTVVGNTSVFSRVAPAKTSTGPNSPMLRAQAMLAADTMPRRAAGKAMSQNLTLAGPKGPRDALWSVRDMGKGVAHCSYGKGTTNRKLCQDQAANFIGHWQDMRFKPHARGGAEKINKLMPMTKGGRTMGISIIPSMTFRKSRPALCCGCHRLSKYPAGTAVHNANRAVMAQLTSDSAKEKRILGSFKALRMPAGDCRSYRQRSGQ